MSRKTNTLLFVLIATLINILLTVISFLLLYLPYSLLIAPRLPPSSLVWTLALLFLLALVISFIAYNALLRLFIKKVDVQKRFGFSPGGRTPGERTSKERTSRD